MDRLSDLPPDIVHEIMSHLSGKELAQSSLLSKRWNNLRKSFGVLDFDQADFTGLSTLQLYGVVPLRKSSVARSCNEEKNHNTKLCQIC